MKSVIFFVFGFILIQQPEKTIKLHYGFEIHVSDTEDLDKYLTYSSIVINHNGRQVHKAKGDKEYKFTNKQYPKVFKISDSQYQILLEVDNRPFGDVLELIHVVGDNVSSIDVLPMFYSKPKNLDSDTNLELGGIWNYGEVWVSKKSGDNVVAYCPILIYEVNQHGLEFDSLTTRNVNTRIYGNYYGAKYNENIEFPKVQWEQKFYKELHRIQK